MVLSSLIVSIDGIVWWILAFFVYSRVSNHMLHDELVTKGYDFLTLSSLILVMPYSIDSNN